MFLKSARLSLTNTFSAYALLIVGALVSWLYTDFACAQNTAPPLQEEATFVTTNQESAPSEVDDLITQGRYLTIAADCYACHTDNRNQPYAGGSGMVTPLGTLYPSNITPDIETGIGSWSEDEFYRALHEGIGKSGENLYPAMPYDTYTLITRDDALAIRAYLFSITPVQRANRPHDLQFPYNYRWLLIGWNLLNFHAGEFKPNSAKSDAVNRGAYLTRALGHCGTCHTPRTITMATETNRFLAGTAITNGWYAPNITPDEYSGIGKWSNAELFQYLRTGSVPGKATASGPMGEAIAYSTSQLSDSDINSIIAWLRDQTPIRNAAEQANNSKSHFEWGQRRHFFDQVRQTLAYVPPATSSMPADIQTGAQIYYGACASCHGSNGAGVTQAGFPSLVNNTSLGMASANNVVMTILYGVDRTIGQAHVFMPQFKEQLSDEEITQLTNWLFTNYGRPNTRTTANDVHTLRLGTPVGEAPIIAVIKASGVAVIALGIIFVLGWAIRLSPRIKAFFTGLRRKRQSSAKTQKTAFASTTAFNMTKIPDTSVKKTKDRQAGS